jgi:hypothetical protein
MTRFRCFVASAALVGGAQLVACASEEESSNQIFPVPGSGGAKTDSGGSAGAGAKSAKGGSAGAAGGASGSGGVIGTGGAGTGGAGTGGSGGTTGAAGAGTGGSSAGGFGGSCSPSWQCANWTTCSCSGNQTRSCTDSNNCGTQSGKPAETETCNPCGNGVCDCGETNSTCATECPVGPCTPSWQCGSWSACSCSNSHSRTCSDSNNCGKLDGKPAVTETCNPCGNGLCDCGESYSTCSSDCRCTGCLSAGTCMAGTTKEACGTGAGPCNPCKAYEKCQDGYCVFDDTSLWGLVVVSANISTNGTPCWDSWPDCLPDPVAIVTATWGGVHVSPTIQNTNTPTWTYLIVSQSPASAFFDGFDISVADDDNAAPNYQWIGGCMRQSVNQSTLINSGPSAMTACAMGFLLGINYYFVSQN